MSLCADRVPFCRYSWLSPNVWGLMCERLAVCDGFLLDAGMNLYSPIGRIRTPTGQRGHKLLSSFRFLALECTREGLADGRDSCPERSFVRFSQLSNSSQGVLITIHLL
jgi:hypothetical protein